MIIATTWVSEFPFVRFFYFCTKKNNSWDGGNDKILIYVLMELT